MFKPSIILRVNASFSHGTSLFHKKRVLGGRGLPVMLGNLILSSVISNFPRLAGLLRKETTAFMMYYLSYSPVASVLS